MGQIKRKGLIRKKKITPKSSSKAGGAYSVMAMIYVRAVQKAREEREPELLQAISWSNQASVIRIWHAA